MNVPVIDLSAFHAAEASSSDKNIAVEELHAACRDVGFFYVTSPAITDAIIDDAFDAVKAFFDLSDEVKQGVAATNSPLYRGYQGMDSPSHSCAPPSGGDGQDENGAVGTASTPVTDTREPIKDLKESFTIGALGNDSPMHGDNQWPSLESFSQENQDKLQRYWSSMMQLSMQISRCLAMSLGLDEAFFITNMTNPVAQMVSLRYPSISPKSTSASSSCGAHTDCGFLTLLAQEKGTPGLEIKTKQPKDKDKNTADMWIAAPQLSTGTGAVLCNLGDMAESWSNDYYKSTWHRVNNTSGKLRHSIPFFCNLDYNASVDPSTSVCKGTKKDLIGQVPKYPPTCAGDYICKKLGLMHLSGTGIEAAAGGGAGEADADAVEKKAASDM